MTEQLAADTTTHGYTFFDPATGAARYVRVRYSPFRTAWTHTPTRDDISGIDMSGSFIPSINFSLDGIEERQRDRIIQYGYELGIDLAEQVNSLPDNYIREYLFNVIYNRPMSTIDDLPIRLGDSLVVNPYTLAPAYLIRYLLLKTVSELNHSGSSAMILRAGRLMTIANHLQFIIDRTLVRFNLTDPFNNIILEGRTVSQTQDDIVIAKHTNLYVAELNYKAWVAKGGDELLLVAEWGLYNRLPTDSTIANKKGIMAAWANAQTPHQ